MDKSDFTMVEENFNIYCLEKAPKLKDFQGNDFTTVEENFEIHSSTTPPD